jgi:hypothetical protein
LVEEFAKWVRLIPVPTTFDLVTPRLRVDPTARFITFNYTTTLQSLYRVAPGYVWHIHGCAADPADRLVLGHGWKPAKRET